MSKIELIAEISSNHGGSMALAKEFIARFAEAGATFVKFQHTRVKHLRPDDPQWAWFQRAEFSLEQFAELKAACEQAGTKFLTTVYHAADVPEVASLGLEAIKIGSGEAGEYALAKAIAESQIPRVLVGCGLVQPAKCPLRYHGGGERAFLRCITRYPGPSLMAASAYGREYLGWSDHCVGLDGCQIALLHGARIIEKHVQLPQQARPCQPWEATVEQFTQLRAFADDDPSRFLGRWQAA